MSDVFENRTNLIAKWVIIALVIFVILFALIFIGYYFLNVLLVRELFSSFTPLVDSFSI